MKEKRWIKQNISFKSQTVALLALFSNQIKKIKTKIIMGSQFQCYVILKTNEMWEISLSGKNNFANFFVIIQNLVLCGEIQTQDLSITDKHATVFPFTKKSTEGYFACWS